MAKKRVDQDELRRGMLVHSHVASPPQVVRKEAGLLGGVLAHRSSAARWAASETPSFACSSVDTRTYPTTACWCTAIGASSRG